MPKRSRISEPDGWFDESGDEDDAPSSVPVDEVDPLDAFVSGIAPPEKKEAVDDPLDSFILDMSSKTESKEEETEDDPLDSFMSALAENEPRKRARLDLEEEEVVERFEEETEDVIDDPAGQEEEDKPRDFGPTALTNFDLSYPADPIQFNFLNASYPVGSAISVNNNSDDVTVYTANSSSSAPLPLPLPPPTNSSISCTLPLPPAMMSHLRMTYSRFTLIQSYSLPLSLGGHDLLATAPTGSGKTISYVIPAVVHAVNQREVSRGEGPIAIILSPTRELAKQIFTEIKRFASTVNCRVVNLIGGNTTASASTYELTKELKKGGVEFVVGTPGRVIDMVKKRGTNLLRVTFVVLDEADKMLEMGFEDQVLSIMRAVRKERQTLMFSATFGRRVRRVAVGVMKRNKITVEVGRVGRSSVNVAQLVHVFKNYHEKNKWLHATLPSLVRAGRTIVFVGSRKDTEKLAGEFRTVQGIQVESIHGDKSQGAREDAIKQFRKGTVNVLFATDVASRGLDIDNVACVVNYQPAKDYDSHCHRVGRAGRLSKSGTGEANFGVGHTCLVVGKDRRFGEILYGAMQREGRDAGEDLRRFVGGTLNTTSFGNNGSSNTGSSNNGSNNSSSNYNSNSNNNNNNNSNNNNNNNNNSSNYYGPA